MWKGYDGIYALFGLEHLTVNHSVEYVNQETGVQTNFIEGSWAGIKMRIPIRSRVSNEIGMHLFEIIWHRCHEKDLWTVFLSALREVAFD